MTLRRRRPLAEAALGAARQLARCEARTALLDRVRPLNLVAERARLVAAAQAGQRPALELWHAARPELGDVRRALADIARGLEPTETEQALLLGRAGELELEAQLAEQVAQPGFRALAASRFALPDEHGALREAALALLGLPDAAPDAAQLLHDSDDARDPLSLLSLLSQRVFAEKLAVRVEVDPGLVPLAAVADGVVRVRAGARLTADVARRIALHEVEGHVLPRALGAALGGVFLAGSARASEDEEGRAILLEERAGLLDVVRRRELGRRYLAAASVRQGADFWATFELLRETGAEVTECVELGLRVHRGGGLGRELVYFAGYRRVLAALGAEPRLERVQQSGRVSLVAARALLLDSVQLDDDRNVI